MKKKFSLKCISVFIALSLNVSGAMAQITDPNFYAFVVNRYPGCVVGGNLDLTCSEIVNEDTLIVNASSITTFAGIESFTNLVYLDISGTDFDGYSSVPQLPPNLKGFRCTSLDFEHLGAPFYFNLGNLGLNNPPASLEYLDCSNNYAINLPPLPPNLKYLNCSWNALNLLPALPASLETLICNNNANSVYDGVDWIDYGFNSLGTLGPALKYLNCSSNRLTGLPVLPGTLTYLSCYANSIGANGNPFPQLPSSLEYLNCYSNQIPDLHILPETLAYLNCNGNPTSNIANLPPALTYLSCAFNNLNILPAFPPGLKTIYCDNNHLTSLPALPDSLLFLNCNENELTSMPPLPSKLNVLICSRNNISCLPHFPPTMGDPPVGYNRNLGFDSEDIVCFPNIVNGMTVTSNSGDTIPPLCSPVNNVHQCHSDPLITGHVFYDNNSNGIKDVNEYNRPNIRLQLSNGVYAHSNLEGYYEISGSLGINTLTVDPPPYYTAAAVPDFNFSTYDTLVTKDISLQPNSSVDSFNISIIAVNPARPGFSFPYVISYENVGTTTVAPLITVFYDNTLLTYNSSSNAAVSNNGSSLSLAESPFVPGQPGSFTANFTVKTSAQLNAIVFSQATITANGNLAVDTTYTIVTGSFDPNDKQATPKLTIQNVSDGGYIDYLVRFQNTGTDTAFNIVVTDTLSSLLNASSFQMIAASHPCKITQEADKLAFEFINILLPDSNVNEPKSHGFIRFRVKPVSTVPVNTLIPNEADIYFDYNAPVLTNIANTLIQPTIIPLTLLSFNALINHSDKSVLLYWKTAAEMNTSFFEIQRSRDGVNFETVGHMNAYGQGDHAYNYKVQLQNTVEYYRLKMFDIDHRFAFSTIVKVRMLNNNDRFAILNNPVKGIMTIETYDASLQNSAATIINNLGSVVYSFRIQAGVQHIDLDKLAPGIYYLRTIAGTAKLFINK
jgi:uncharacterized repeat protein (TIGR01451 family)